MIFGTLTPEKNWHKNLTDLSTSSVRRIYFTWEIQKSFSTVLFIHTSDYLHYLRRKQTVIHLPTPPENVITLTCEMQNFFIWLKVCYVLSNGGGSEESQLWVVIGGSKRTTFFCTINWVPITQTMLLITSVVIGHIQYCVLVMRSKKLTQTWNEVI